MRVILGLALAGVVVLGTAGASRAADRDRALAVVEQGIKAQGGAEGLIKAQTSSRSAAGVQSQGGQELSFTSDVIVALPDRVRMTITIDKKFQFITVINGDRGWQTAGGAAVELAKGRLQEIREEAYVWWLANLVPLTKDDFTLVPLPDAKVAGRPAAVVKVAQKGHPDSKLYFDKGTGLLSKIERRASEAGLQVDKEYLYSDYKDFDGVKLATKEVLLVNGKKWYEVTVSEYKLLPKVDDKTFFRP